MKYLIGIVIGLFVIAELRTRGILTTASSITATTSTAPSQEIPYAGGVAIVSPVDDPNGGLTGSDPIGNPVASITLSPSLRISNPLSFSLSARKAPVLSRSTGPQ